VGEEAGLHLVQLVGDGQHAVVVGGHDHHATLVGHGAQHPQHALHLHVVEVGGGLVGQHQAGVVGEGAGDGDALLLAARQVPGRWAVRSPRPTRSSSCSARSLACLLFIPLPVRGSITFSSALRLGTS